MANDIDYSDPCAVLEKLRPAYYALLAGDRVASVSFDSRTVSYDTGDLKTLAGVISQLEDACAKKQGLPTRRYAMRLGARR